MVKGRCFEGFYKMFTIVTVSSVSVRALYEDVSFLLTDSKWQLESGPTLAQKEIQRLPK